MNNENKKSGRSFLTISLPQYVMFNNWNEYLKWAYWKDIIPTDAYSETDQWKTFKDALNWIECWSEYTLFQIVPGFLNDSKYIVLIFEHK